MNSDALFSCCFVYVLYCVAGLWLWAWLVYDVSYYPSILSENNLYLNGRWLIGSGGILLACQSTSFDSVTRLWCLDVVCSLDELLGIAFTCKYRSFVVDTGKLMAPHLGHFHLVIVNSAEAMVEAHWVLIFNVLGSQCLCEMRGWWVRSIISIGVIKY